MLREADESLPAGVDFTNRVIYYVGPVDPVRDEVVGPAGPTTATRMDQVHRDDARENRPDRDDRQSRTRPGGHRSDPANTRRPISWPSAVPPIWSSKAIKSSRVVAFGDLGMEAIYEFEVKDMPVTVAVDSTGTSVHQSGPAEWSQKIAATAIPTRTR
jgi:fumarate hydratase class I